MIQPVGSNPDRLEPIGWHDESCVAAQELRQAHHGRRQGSHGGEPPVRWFQPSRDETKAYTRSTEPRELVERQIGGGITLVAQLRGGAMADMIWRYLIWRSSALNREWKARGGSGAHRESGEGVLGVWDGSRGEIDGGGALERGRTHG